MSAVLFLNLAQKWEKIIKFWSKNEKPFLVKPYTALKNKGTLKKRIVNISIIIFAMAACKQIQFLSLCIIFIGLVIFFLSKWNISCICVHQSAKNFLTQKNVASPFFIRTVSFCSTSTALCSTLCHFI
jgi:hypothetical protein